MMIKPKTCGSVPMTMLKSSLGIGFIAMASAGFAWVIGAGTALAPEPARLSEMPSSSTLAVPTYVEVIRASSWIVWPAGYTSSANPPPVGMPCATGALPDGAEIVKRISGGGHYRRCVMWDPNYIPPANAITLSPLPPLIAYEPTLTANMLLSANPFKWPANWTYSAQPIKAGKPCYDVDLFPGEPSNKHIQVFTAGSLYSRCVPNTERTILQGTDLTIQPSTSVISPIPVTAPTSVIYKSFIGDGS